MKIGPNALVTLNVRMYDAQGQLLEATVEPLTYLHGAQDIFARIEQALEGQEAGYSTALVLEPHEAFGDDDPQLLHLVARSQLGRQVAIGMRTEGVPGQPPDGRIYTVIDLADDVVVLDGNHPLAGHTLRFEVAVLTVEAASAEELAQANAPQVPHFMRAVPAHDLHEGTPHEH